MAKAFYRPDALHGCRGCQIACKQWKNLPAENDEPRRTYEPADLSSDLQTVHMREVGKERTSGCCSSLNNAAIANWPRA
ncbi:MAG: hypothetical protein ACLR7Z_15525 [Bilophila wadsworthia]